MRSDADLIEVILQLGAPVFAASEVNVVAEREGLFEVHVRSKFSFP